MGRPESGAIAGWAFQLRDDKWSRVFIKCIESTRTLELYRTPEAGAPLTSITLPEASLREVTLNGLLPHGVATHARGLVLTAPCSREESPRAITDLRASSLDLPDGDDASRSSLQLILAGDDAIQQDAWARVLKERVASATMLPPSVAERVSTPSAAAVAAPPTALLRWIAAERSLAPSLVDSLHAARSALLASQRGSAVLTSDPAAGVHAPLSELQRCFAGLESRLAAAVAVAGAGAVESLGPAESASVRAWLQNAGAYCLACSKVAGNALFGGEPVEAGGGGFAATAAAAAAALESAETALLDEIARQKRAKLAAETGTLERRLSTAGRVRPSAQPYAQFWAKKIAV